MSDPTALVAELERLRAELAERDRQIDALKLDTAKKDEVLARKDDEIRALQYKLDALARQLFGAKSERVSPGQLRLAFDAAAADVAQEAGEKPSFVHEAPDEETPSSRGKRKRKPSGRLPLPQDLPRVREEHHPSADQLVCPCGAEKQRMGEEVSEQLDFQPARFRVIEHVRVKYVCRGCNAIPRPPLPPAPIDKGRPSAGVLADLVVSKYGDHLPLHRLEQVYARQGVHLSKQTLCDWVRESAGLLEPVADEIRRQILTRPVIQTDETGILVKDHRAPGNRRKGRIWVYCGAPGELHFAYSPTKESKHPLAYLAGYEGVLQADAYGGFDVLYKHGTILEAGCNAHARRKFFDARDASPTEAGWALIAYQKLFAVEREAKERGLSADERLALRRERSTSIWEGYYGWLEQLQAEARPRSPLGAAVRYAMNHREALGRFLEDGRVELDNNRSERSLRKVAVGRKNWLFAGSTEGAERAAVLYTLVVSCRELGLPVWEYLRDVLDLVTVTPASEVGSLTPRGWAKRHGHAVPDGFVVQ